MSTKACSCPSTHPLTLFFSSPPAHPLITILCTISPLFCSHPQTTSQWNIPFGVHTFLPCWLSHFLLSVSYQCPWFSLISLCLHSFWGLFFCIIHSYYNWVIHAMVLSKTSTVLFPACMASQSVLLHIWLGMYTGQRSSSCWWCWIIVGLGP